MQLSKKHCRSTQSNSERATTAHRNSRAHSIFSIIVFLSKEYSMKTYKIIVASALTLVQSSFPTQNGLTSPTPQSTPSSMYPSSDYLNRRTVTQFTIGLVANGLSKNNYKHKLIANGIGLTCGLAAHVFLNSDYAQSSGHTADDTTSAESSVFTKLFANNLKSSALGYGVGATTGALSRALFDKTKQWMNRKPLAQPNPDTLSLTDIKLILGDNDMPISHLYLGEEKSIKEFFIDNLRGLKYGSHTIISKNAWESFVKDELARARIYNITTLSASENSTTVLIPQTAFNKWKELVASALQERLEYVAELDVKGAVITQETIEKIQHNKIIVDEAIKKVVAVIL